MFYENNSSDKTLKTTVKLNGMQGIKFKKPDRHDTFDVNIAPGQYKLAIATVDVEGWSASIGESNISIS